MFRHRSTCGPFCLSFLLNNSVDRQMFRAGIALMICLASRGGAAEGGRTRLADTCGDLVEAALTCAGDCMHRLSAASRCHPRLTAASTPHDSTARAAHFPTWQVSMLPYSAMGTNMAEDRISSAKRSGCPNTWSPAFAPASDPSTQPGNRPRQERDLSSPSNGHFRNSFP